MTSRRSTRMASKKSTDAHPSSDPAQEPAQLAPIAFAEALPGLQRKIEHKRQQSSETEIAKELLETAETAQELATPGLPPLQSKTEHKRQQSSETEVAQQLLEVAAGIIEGVSANLVKDGVLNLDEVSNLETAAKETVEVIKSIAKFVKEHEGWDVQAVSFSRMRNKHLLRLGVSTLHTVTCKAFAGFLLEMEREASKEVQNAMAIWDPNPLGESIAVWEKHAGGGTEACSGLVVNQFIYSLIVFCHPLDRSSNVFPELTLAKAGNSPASFINNDKRKATFLTGSTDYGVITLQWDRPHLTEEAEEVTTLLSASTLSDVLNARRHMKKDSNLVIIEVKNPNEPLRAHIPQAVGEAMAGIEVVKKMKLTSNHSLSFALTNGRQWIFGAINESADSMDYACYLTETLSAPSFSIEAQSKALFFWAILTLFFSKATSSGATLCSGLRGVASTKENLQR
ncbi:hypothetical protein PC9H_009512 [Pleurotus ostreatus]|uniref:Uncharacterized protein n=1 Tax=Pleurotus ostreatus TaxID=5322 RepID=A0A8H6ZM19_PLEOS|nr:uncharacterized protein PC9H_009512 [Pleurotus ostreatus]KAF7424208.1 hypothetical protein PC9H_009512 [Pleurotus ostreatus]